MDWTLMPSAADLGKLVRMEIELHELPPAAKARQEKALDHLCQIVPAEAGAIRVLQTARGGGKLHSLVARGWEGTRQGAALRKILRNPSLDTGLLANPALRPGTWRTDRLGTLITNGASAANGAQPIGAQGANGGDEPAPNGAGLGGFEHSMHSCLPAPLSHERVVLSFFRGVGAEAFTPEQCNLVAAAHSAMDWIQQGGSSEVPTNSITPRQHQALQGLLAGESEKQVAARLGVSGHTVHVHIKALYRHFSVSTRAELLTKLLPI